jgi:hypothetical protein
MSKAKHGASDGGGRPVDPGALVRRHERAAGARRRLRPAQFEMYEAAKHEASTLKAKHALQVTRAGA